MIRKQQRHCISSLLLCGLGLAALSVACSSSAEDAAEDTGGGEPGGQEPSTTDDGNTPGMEPGMDDEQMAPDEGNGAGVTKVVRADFFPAYDEDGGLLVAVAPR